MCSLDVVAEGGRSEREVTCIESGAERMRCLACGGGGKAGKVD